MQQSLHLNSSKTSIAFDNGTTSHEVIDCQTESFGIDLFFLAVTSVLGSFGNSLILVSVFFLPGMQRSMNWFVANIALADLIISVVIIPSIFANRLACSDVISSPTVCQVKAFVVFLCAGVSNFSFMLIAINRRMFVLDRKYYHRFFSKRMICLQCSASWLVWLGFGVIVCLLDSLHYIPEAFACFYYDNRAPFEASLFLTLLGVALPTGIAILSYISLFVTIFQARIRALKNQMADSSLGEKLQLFNRERRSLLTAIVAFSLFNICWGPYSVHIYIDKFVSSVPIRVHKTVLWMSIMNSVLNPIVYGAFNSQFRESFKKILRIKSMKVMPAVVNE